MSKVHEQAEQLGEQVMEAVGAGVGEAAESEGPPWTHWVAFASLVMGLFSALGALLAGAAANEAILERTREILEMQKAEGHRMEAQLLRNRILLEQAAEVPGDPTLMARAEALDAQAEAIEARKGGMERFVRDSVEDHEILEAAVTLFAIAISFCGMSVITRRERLFHVGLGIGGLGLVFFGWGVVWFL